MSDFYTQRNDLLNDFLRFKTIFCGYFTTKKCGRKFVVIVMFLIKLSIQSQLFCHRSPLKNQKNVFNLSLSDLIHSLFNESFTRNQYHPIMIRDTRDTFRDTSLGKSSGDNSRFMLLYKRVCFVISGMLAVLRLTIPNWHLRVQFLV